MAKLYYSRNRLLGLAEDQLSFAISNNLVDSAFFIIQHPFEILRGRKHAHHYLDKIADYDLLASFLSTVTATELLLKSILANNNWRLLAGEKSQLTRESLINGDFKSVGLERCVDSIEKSGIARLDQETKNQLEKARTARNKLAHYYYDFDKEHLFELIAFGLDIFIDLYRLYVKEQILDSFDRTEDFEAELSEIVQFVNIRVESNSRRNSPLSEIIGVVTNECQNCYTYNLAIDSTRNIRCRFCGHQIEMNEYAGGLTDTGTQNSFCSTCNSASIIARKGRRYCIVCGKE